ncbi:MAG: sulfur carrier protein ThiS [Anaerolineae bacterium]
MSTIAAMIRVNNRDEIEWEEGLTVSDLLERFNYTFPHIIVTIDGGVVPREEYPARTIPDNADVRVIHLIAGG